MCSLSYYDTAVVRYCPKVAKQFILSHDTYQLIGCTKDAEEKRVSWNKLDEFVYKISTISLNLFSSFFLVFHGDANEPTGLGGDG